MRKLAIAAAVSLSLNSGAHALGLGEIEMFSALNESLDAEIAILSASEEELEGMRVNLASATAFARAGLVQLPVLSSVAFDVDRRPDGKPVVKLTSVGPVVEPFLNFLIEIEAPGSVKLVREYTVLLDPPSYQAENTAADTATAAVATYTPNPNPAVSDAVFTGDSATQGGGIAIDLSDLNSGDTTTTDALADTEATSEVAFTETTVNTSVSSDLVTAATINSDEQPLDDTNLFVPDDQVFANAASGTTVVGSEGQIISLQQELNTTPSFEQAELTQNTSTADAGNASSIPLDNLGAQGEPGAPIFDSEFDSAELIAGDELRSLVEPDTTETPQVDFTESTFSEASQTLAESDTLLLPDTDAAGFEEGDLIDLSGIIGTESAAESSTVSLDNRVSTDSPVFSESSGNTYRVQSSDTLWRVANETKARGVTPHQMMVALLNTNPSAFVGGNMNRLVQGAVLDIPTADSQRSVDAADALAIVRSFTRGNATYTPPTVENVIVDSAPIKSFEESTDSEIVVDDSSLAEAELNRNLEDVNRRMELARSDLASETLQRDELQGRVNSLEDNMEQMKGLITLRENQLDQLQDKVADAESAAAELDTEQSALSNASDNMDDLQNKLTEDLAEAQNAIERKADMEKNLATVQAEAQSIKLSSEEDALRAQLAALEIEKRDLISTSQAEKAELVRQSENDKTILLQQAKAERERIMAELESEKARISTEAETEIARIRNQSDTENQRVLAEAQVERDRLAAETEEMQAKLSEMEVERARLLEAAELEAAQTEAEKAELQTKADEQARLAAAAEAERDRLEKEASQTASLVEDTKSSVNEIAADGKSMIGDGADKMSGLLGAGPLSQSIGDRKTILGVGAGLSLLGLLGAWAVRRRKTPQPESPALRPRADVRRPAPAKTNFDDRKSMHGSAAQQGTTQSRSSNQVDKSSHAGAAVAGTAAAAAVASRDSSAHEAPQQPAANEVELEDVALDDTITEAEVYLRYGLHGQAEDLLKTAIDRSPDNEEYHFKLLENYHDQKNASAFNDAASTFSQKFTQSEHHDRIAEMAAELNVDDSGDDSGNSNGGTAGVAGAAATGAAVAAGAGVVASGKDAIAGVGSMLDRKPADGDDAESLLDQTIDPGSEFSVDELQATGDLNALTDGEQFGDQGGMSLDDVDLASLDDDGTMNLEDITGSQMSGADLGTLDLTNTDMGFDDVNPDGVGSNSTPDLTNIRSGIESNFPVEGQAPGGSDEMETQLDLAKAYMDMGDKANAEKALRDIAARGNPMQQLEAGELLKKLS